MRYDQFPCAIITKQNVSEFISEVYSKFFNGIQVFHVLPTLHAIKSVSLKLCSRLCTFCV